LAAVEGVSLISLQKNFGVEQIKTLGDDFNLIDLDGIAEEADGFQRTASIIANLDLVIAADTSVAHLAGAMGVPVWLALPMSPDWRWLLGRQDTPWYPTMRLFRQQSDGDWNELMSRMAVGLADRVTSLFAGKSSTGPVPSIADLSKLVRTAKEHLQAGRFSEAEGTFRSALAADPLNFELYQDLGVALAKQNRMPEALDHFRRGLELSPESAGLYGNIGVAYQHLGRHEEAVAHFRKSIWLGSGSANTHKNLANALMALPDPAAAEESLLAALRLEPDDAEAHYMLSQALLMQGKYDAGWLEQEWRWKWKSNAKRIPQCPRWAGQALTGKRLLIVCEEDPRDTIQLMRYADLVHHLGGRVVVECTEELAELLKGCAGVEQVVLAGGDGPGCDLYSYIKSMPLAYSSVFGSVPAPRPYLGVLPQHVTLWNQRLGNESLKVAVVVGRQNRMFHIYDVLRSLNDGPPLQILAISQEPDASSYVVERAGDRHHTSSRYSATLAEVAGALRSAELVISEDDLLGHVAAAMGVATWITLPVVAHPRWLTHRDDSPWYPSVRLFRHVRVQEFPAYAGHVAESAHKWLNNSPRREQTAD
jgi:tetratricopeptide (TPR) repeat protein